MSVPLPDAWLGQDPLPTDPIPVAQRWLAEAFAAGRQENPHAIALATVDPDGAPSVRMVLCTLIQDDGGIVFHSNRSSRKGMALAGDPRAAAVFHWPNRQVRVEGRVELLADPQSDAYFAGRPRESQLGAWASDQSAPIDSRDDLIERMAQVAQRFGEGQIPRPPNWGGYLLRATSVEIWASRPGRIHDRALWTRAALGWSAQRLQP